LSGPLNEATRPRVYLSPPDVGEEERKALLDAFDSNWIAPLGPDVDAFEAELAAKVQMPYAVALSSGTAALHLALHLVGVSPGDEVLVPTLTFVATAGVAVHLGARPVFVDSEPATWQIDPDIVERTLRERAKNGTLPAAVVSVDLYGQSADYEPLEELCKVYDIPLVEDAAEALGATYRDRPVGSFGGASVFSFNGNKIITTSGGGMLVTDSEQLAEKARYFATQAREPLAHYEHLAIGYNYRLSNLLAALGRGQLRGLEERVERRRQINARYRSGLSSIPGMTFMPVAPYGRPNYWLTCVLVDAQQFGADREEIRLALEAVNIEARPTWKPLHLQPVFADAQVMGGEVAASIFERGLCLPSGSSLTDTDLDRVIDVIGHLCSTNR
jgi:dTDP-4-amino-4,6-dideoxygalactose transaminase